MKVYRSKNGYFYKEYKNGKKKEYQKMNIKNLNQKTNKRGVSIVVQIK